MTIRWAERSALAAQAREGKRQNDEKKPGDRSVRQAICTQVSTTLGDTRDENLQLAASRSAELTHLPM